MAEMREETKIDQMHATNIHDKFTRYRRIKIID